MSSGATGPAASPSWARTAAVAAAAGAAAAIVRIVVLRDMDAANPLFRVPILDEAVYLREAKRFLDGSEPDGPAPLVSLAWPRLLAALGVAVRPGASAVNVCLGSATAALAAAGALRWTGSTVAGAVAGAIVAFSGALAFQDTTAGIETLLGLLTLAAALAIVRASVAQRTPAWIAAGLAVGAAATGRMTHLAIAFASVPAMLRRRAAEPHGDGDAPPPSRRNPLTHPFAWSLLAGIVAAGFALGRVPSSWGVNVWLGNCAWSQATLSFGTDEFPMDPDGERNAAFRIAAGGRGPVGTAEVNRYWLGRAWDEAAADPSGALAHAARKSLLVLYAPDMGGNHDIDVEREFSPLLRVLPASGAWILVAAVAGWFVLRRRTPGAGTALLVVVAFTASLVVVFPLTRYRAPVLPFAAVLAGAGIAAGWSVLRDRGAPRRDVVAAAAVAAALLAASVAATAIRPESHAEGWTNVGLAETEHGTRGSDRWFRRALEDTPGHPPAAVMCGVMALDRRDFAAALAAFDDAIAGSGGRRDRAARDAAQGRARALSGLGRHADAAATYDAARREFPDDPEIAIDGVFLALAAGDRDAAVQRLDVARGVAPGHPRLAEAARAVRR